MLIITNEQLFEKLSAVEALLAVQATSTKAEKFKNIDDKSMQLWTIQDIADYTQKSYRHVQSALLPSPYFPKAVRLPEQRNPNKKGQKRLWFAGEVVRYVRRMQG